MEAHNLEVSQLRSESELALQRLSSELTAEREAHAASCSRAAEEAAAAASLHASERAAMRSDFERERSKLREELQRERMAMEAQMAAQAAAAEADLAALSRSFSTAKEAARQDAEVARAEAAREIARQRSLVEELRLETERSKSGLVMKLGRAVDDSEVGRVRAEARCAELEAALRDLQLELDSAQGVGESVGAAKAKGGAAAMAESERVQELLGRPQREAAEQALRGRKEKLRAAFGAVRVVSGSADGTLRVWGVADGARGRGSPFAPCPSPLRTLLRRCGARLNPRSHPWAE